jgi:hypothetical protein
MILWFYRRVTDDLNRLTVANYLVGTAGGIANFMLPAMQA